MIRPVDLGVCSGYAWDGDPARAAIALPGAMLGGMPSLAFPLSVFVARGWSAVQVWDEFLDRSVDPTPWVRERVEAAIAAAKGAERLVLVAKSLSTRAAGLAAERSIPAVWLTPLLDDPESVDGLRRRTAPALLVGGTADPTWDGRLARELSDDVLELPGADHGLGTGADPRPLLANLERIVERVDALAARLEA
jgi:pimeloyl-ACP methyl ester carboxylesterase